jgi:hypothetical protein
MAASFNTITLLFYLVRALLALGAVIGGLGSMARSFIAGLEVLALGLILVAMNYFLARFFKEGALILADVGDSIVDANARLCPEQSAAANG